MKTICSKVTQVMVKKATILHATSDMGIETIQNSLKVT